jgi:hypothetical protein
VSGWVRAPGVLWRNALDRAVVLPPDAAEPLVLNAPGAALWALLEEPYELEDAATTLATAAGVDVNRVANDIATLLRDLNDAGAVGYQP